MTEECYQYMHTDEGKLSILNPDGQTPIMKVTWSKSFLEEIQNRIAQYIEKYLKSEKVTNIFEEIKTGNIKFYRETSKYISTMEVQWTNEQGEKRHASDSNEEIDLPLYIEIPILVVTVVLSFIAGAIALALSPILGPVILIIYKAEKKKALKEEFVNTAYSTYMLTVRSQIQDHLRKSSGDALKLLSDKLINHSLSNQINHLEELIQNLERSRKEILVNMESFRDLAKKVETMKMSALKL